MQNTIDLMRRAILVTVVLFSLWPDRATAGGNELLEHCEFFGAKLSAKPMEANASGYCIGYILGVHDALADEGTFCVPKGPSGVTKGQLGDTVKLYLRDHPETRHLSAVDLISAALKEKFPCN